MKVSLVLVHLVAMVHTSLKCIDRMLHFECQQLFVSWLQVFGLPSKWTAPTTSFTRSMSLSMIKRCSSKLWSSKIDLTSYISTLYCSSECKLLTYPVRPIEVVNWESKSTKYLRIELHYHILQQFGTRMDLAKIHFYIYRTYSNNIRCSFQHNRYSRHVGLVLDRDL